MKLDTSKRSTVVLLALIGVGVMAMMAKTLVLDERDALKVTLANEEKAHKKLRGVEDQLRVLKRRWSDLAGRTLARDEAVNKVDALLKQTVSRRSLTGVSVNTGMSNRSIAGSKPAVTIVTSKVNAEGSIFTLVHFLNDLLSLPMLTRLPSLRITPATQTGGGRDMKFDLTVETLVFPNGESLPRWSPLVLEDSAGMTPFHDLAFALDKYDRIPERNIFAAFVPPPHSQVTIRNDDRKGIRVTLTSSWEDKPRDTKSMEVAAGQSTSSETLEGDRIEAVATYQDGQTFKQPKDFTIARRFDDATSKFQFRVPMHTPEEKTDVEVTIQNNDALPIDVAVQLKMSGEMTPLAPVKVMPGKTHKLKKFETPEMTLTATYEGGVAAAPGRFTPNSPRPMMYTVPPKPAGGQVVENVVPQAEPPPTADPNLRVTALFSYLPEGQELIATNDTTRERRIFPLHDSIDGGQLIFVHSLGGLVKMPNGEFYLYPYGMKFTDRKMLATAAVEAQLPAALAALAESDELIVHPADSGGGAPPTPGGPRPNMPARPGNQPGGSPPGGMPPGGMPPGGMPKRANFNRPLNAAPNGAGPTVVQDRKPGESK